MTYPFFPKLLAAAIGFVVLVGVTWLTTQLRGRRPGKRLMPYAPAVALGVLVVGLLLFRDELHLTSSRGVVVNSCLQAPDRATGRLVSGALALCQLSPPGV